MSYSRWRLAAVAAVETVQAAFTSLAAQPTTTQRRETNALISLCPSTVYEL
jgi:hypothetical protein